ncbi:CHAT domain-containing protein [Halotia branconii]|uniref:CHAT domain-containing protein n=1 Tax=Halotia branconii CENA392 TaxID=1539056 RepID=A0AAJ6NPP2_9CYAN|nr:CHAT domain-containing protein [Halotia branconii]WGV24409.1 CHAT domain-containing protein [Halotia branconii CENA392]
MTKPFGQGTSNRQQATVHLLLYFLLALLCVLASPVLAKVPDVTTSLSQQKNVNITSLQQGKVLYDAGRFAEAAQVLQQVAQKYRQQGDDLRLATTLSNLSLAYQQLGAWTQAQQTITESLNLLKGQEKSQNFLAQSLDIQGRLQLAMGQTQQALATWQQTAKIYQQTENHSGVVRSQINQAQAWRTQGFYRRAVEILEKTTQKLQSQPDSVEKAVGWRSLGDALLVAGDQKNSRLALEQSLKIAQSLQSRTQIGASLFSLGNNARIRQQDPEAIAYYQKTFQVSPSPITKVQAQLNQLSLLIQTKQLAEIEPLLTSIQSQLDQLPPSRAAIYAQINYAQSLMKVLSPDVEFLSRKSVSAISTQNLGKLLAASIKQSRSLGDQRAEAYGLLSLGHLYEKTHQWSEAQTLTEQALILAQTTNASDIAYRLEWQLARLLKAQKDIKGAIAAYDAAVETIHTLRSDLVAINQDVQFNFRDSVEPIYRQSVELLLQSQSGKLDEKILDKARQRIEALQLAELDNFFQEACLQGNSISLDQIVDQDNPTAAILYPIILPDQFQVIVKIPNQPLRHYSTNISYQEVDKIIAKVRKTLINPTATNAVKIQSQQVYNWLIKPIESELSASGVKTLVFVLDGALRNLPMSSLYDGQQFLVEKYAIALSVGLQLQNPKPLVRQELRALTAGLTQPPANFPNFAPLPGIESEVQLIASAGVSTTNLLNQDFTRKALENEVNTSPFNVIHLATHGQFSSRAENTFILAADGPINVTQFDTLLRSRDDTQPGAVELLVLSACQTAAGDDRAALGLAGAAVRAGARSTLASLWQIDDESTALFVGAFYRELKDGNITKAEALRRAQLQLLKHPNYRAPSFWSAYVLIGNWL